MRSPKALSSLLLAACLALAPAVGSAAPATAAPDVAAPEVAAPVLSAGEAGIQNIIDSLAAGDQLMVYEENAETGTAFAFYLQGADTPHLAVVGTAFDPADPNGEGMLQFDTGIEFAQDGGVYLWSLPESEAVAHLDAASIEAIGQGVMQFVAEFDEEFGISELLAVDEEGNPVALEGLFAEILGVDMSAEEALSLDLTDLMTAISENAEYAILDVDDYTLNAGDILSRIQVESRENLKGVEMPTVATHVVITIQPEGLANILSAASRTLTENPVLAMGAVHHAEDLEQLDVTLGAAVATMTEPVVLTMALDELGNPVYDEFTMALGAEDAQVAVNSVCYVFDDFDENGFGAARMLVSSCATVSDGVETIDVTVNMGARAEAAEDGAVTIFAFADMLLDGQDMAGGYFRVDAPADVLSGGIVEARFGMHATDENGPESIDVVCAEEIAWAEDGSLLDTVSISVNSNGEPVFSGTNATVATTIPAETFIDPAVVTIEELGPITAEDVDALLWGMVYELLASFSETEDTAVVMAE